MYEIKTGNYLKPFKVLIDGMEWEVRPTGAGDELALGQAKRRMEFLERKMQSKNETEEDLTLYDSLEQKMYDLFFTKVFKDGTPDNTHVKKWLESTPMAVIMAIFEEIKSQAESKKAEETKVDDEQKAEELPTS